MDKVKRKTSMKKSIFLMIVGIVILLGVSILYLEKSQLTKEINKNEILIKELEQKVEAAIATVDEVALEKEELSSKIQVLEEANQGLEKTNQDLSAEKQKLEKDNAELVKGNTSLRSTISKLEKEKTQVSRGQIYTGSKKNDSPTPIANKPAPQNSSVNTTTGWTTYKMTHYSPYCPGCSGTSAGGYNLRNGITHNGMRMIAVDTRKIPLHSIVEINDNGKVYRALAVDTGGAIKGNKIDLLVPDRNTAYQLGVKSVQLRVVK